MRKAKTKSERVAYARVKKEFIGSYGYYLRQRVDLPALEAAFVKGEIIDDAIEYPNLSREVLAKRAQKIQHAVLATPKKFTKVQVLLHQKLLETNLLLTQERIRRLKVIPADFYSLNISLFGEVTHDQFQELFSNAKKGISAKSDIFHEGYIAQNIQVLSELVQPLSRTVQQLVAENSVENATKKALKVMGMYRRGWRVKVDTTRLSSVVAPKTKQLILGASAINQQKPEKILALLMHELTHVLRSKYRAPMPRDFSEQKDLASFEEGFAHAIERLSVGKSLIPARYWRYLAVGLSWGVDGHPPRTAKEVFDILLPIYKQYGTGADPVHYIFGTVFRVWKGTPLSLAGGAITKDIRYVQGSALFYELLASKKLTKREFRFLLTHKVK